MGKRECEREGEAGGLTIYRQASNQKWTIARERPPQDAIAKRMMPKSAAAARSSPYGMCGKATAMWTVFWDASFGFTKHRINIACCMRCKYENCPTC